MAAKAKKVEPGIRVDGDRRIDLNELRRRRKLQKEFAKPIEDTRVSDTWSRAENRAANAVLDAAEVARMKAMPSKQDVYVEVVDNPDFSRDHAEGKYGNFRKIEASRNANESGIAVLISKKAIDPCQAEAALIFRRLFEAMGGKGARAIDYSREFVEGGRFPDPIGTHQVDAGKKLAAAYEALTEAHGIYSWKIVSYVCGQGLSIHEMTQTRRQRDTMTDNLRAYLDCLAAHWSLSTKRKVSSAK